MSDKPCIVCGVVHPRPLAVPDAQCPTHGDPLVCLACEAEEDARPEWQPAVPDAGLVAQAIREWVKHEWSLREYSALTVDEGRVIDRNAGAIAAVALRALSGKPT